MNHLISTKNIPGSLISVEKEINLNNTKKRYDAVVYSREMKPLVLVECKSPDVAITETTLDQALRYNLILGVNFLLITNGLKEFVVRIESGKGKVIPELPEYNHLI